MTDLKYLKGTIFTLKWCILYPIDKSNSKIKRILYFIWGFLYIASLVVTFIQCFVYLLVTPFNMVEESTVVMNTVLYFCLILSFLSFYYNSGNFVNFVKNVNENFVDSTDNQMEIIEMAMVTKLSDKILLCYMISIMITAILPMGPLMVSVLGGERKIPIEGWFPYDSMKSPLFEITLVWQTFALFNMGTLYGTSDMVFLCCTQILAQQFKILSNNFKNNFYYALIKSGISRTTVLKFSKQYRNLDLLTLIKNYKEIFVVIESEKFRKNNLDYFLKNIKQHKLLVDYTQHINNTLSTFLLTKLAAATFNFIFIYFSVVAGGDESKVLASYFVYALLELFIFTHSGQMLTENADFLWILYDCPWYLCDRTFKKLLLIVQMKVNKRVETKAGDYFSMTAPSFISFVRAACSYIAVLRSVTERGDD